MCMADSDCPSGKCIISDMKCEAMINMVEIKNSVSEPEHCMGDSECNGGKCVDWIC
jgi:hypothetical protein